MDTPTGILIVEKHDKFVDHYIVLGRETDREDGFYTREMDQDDAQYNGHYMMTLQEAVSDFESRKVT